MLYLCFYLKGESEVRKHNLHVYIIIHISDIIAKKPLVKLQFSEPQNHSVKTKFLYGDIYIIV